MNNLDRFKRVVSKWLWLFAIILSIINIVLVCRTSPRERLEFDYLGVIVGSFSLIVTVLVGWNILSVVDIKQSVKNMQTQLSKYENSISSRIEESLCPIKDEMSSLRSLDEATSIQLYKNVGRIEQVIFEELITRAVTDSEVDFSLILYHGLLAARYALSSNDLSWCIGNVRLLNSELSKFADKNYFTISAEYRPEIDECLNILGCDDYLKNYECFMDLKNNILEHYLKNKF